MQGRVPNLVGSDYVWGGNDPDTDGGVDCSGAVLYGLEALGNELEDMNANSIYDDLTVPVEGDPEPGDLSFIDFNGDGKWDLVQTISSEDGSRVNPTGGPANVADNPGSIDELPGPLPPSGDVRRLDWDDDQPNGPKNK